MIVRMLIILFLPLSFAYGQRLSKSVNKDPIDWQKWEIPVPEEEKLKIVETLTTSVEIQYGLHHYTYTIWNLRNDFHIIDFNRDGLHDVIYNGFAGKGNRGIMFFENRNGELVKFRDFYGDIIEIWQSDQWAPISFKVWNYRCCGNYVDFIETYVPELTYEHNVRYILSNKIAFVDGTAFPEEFAVREPVRVIADNARLHIHPADDTIPYDFYYTDLPVIDPAPYNRYFHFKGSVTAVFKKEATGLILAERIVSGRQWYFVMMSRYNVAGGVFCARGDNNGASYYMMGWMLPEVMERSNTVEELITE